MKHSELATQLHEIGAIQFGTFSLKSGIESPIYVDLRRIISYPQLLIKISDLMWKEVHNSSFDLVCGVPYTALPIATAISIQENLPMVMRRKEVKDYGTKRAIEGVYEKGQNCLLIEDLVTSGMSVMETISPLENEGLKISDIVVLIDREQGGKQNLTSKGYNLHAILTLTDILESLQSQNRLESTVVANVKQFIESNQTTGVC